MKAGRQRLSFVLSSILVAGLAFFFVIGGLFFIWLIFLPTPDFNSFDERVVVQSTKIYDRTGEILLYNVHDGIKRTVVPIEEISDYAKKASIAIEDENFYQHRGIQLTAILRAFIVNLSTGTVRQGGSTLTQQVVKNTLLTQDKKLSRKLKEVILALKVEQVLSKDKILELYLNETPYGGNLYGIEEAAKTYFGKNAKNLTLAESAYLAALPQAPTFLSPYGNNRNRLESRKNMVLINMKNQNLITTEEYQEALNERVSFLKLEENNIRAPHFVFFILDQLREKYGEEMIRNSGLKVITTLDWTNQQSAEAIVRRFGNENIKKFKANNAGLVALEPQTGQILAMVGSIDYFDIVNDGNFNTTLAHRQPGSAFKPFVYAAAFNKGYTPETVVFDLPTEFSSNCTPAGRPKSAGVVCYSPVNYDNTFIGPVTFRDALAQSRNVPSVKVLYLTGVSNAIKIARQMGINTLTDASRYGLTLVLGGGEVTLLEMTSAYGVFATDGKRHPYTGILKVEDSSGKILEEYKNSEVTVLDENVARQISDILSDDLARSPVFGLNSLLNIPGHQVAVKTGTTNNYRDAWIIGYTKDIVVGAWAGNNDNSPMERKIAGMIIAPLWNAFMTDYLATKTNRPFIKPIPTPNNLKPVLKGFWQGSRNYFIDSISGKLATEYTPPELIQEKVLTEVHSILYWIDKNNPRGPIPINPQNDPQFILWETPVRTWAALNGINDQDERVIPMEKDDIHLPDREPKINIILTKREYSPEETIQIQIQNKDDTQISQVDFFLNGVYLGTVKNSPYSFSFIPKDFNLEFGTNQIKVVAYDLFRNKGETEEIFILNQL